MKIEEFKNKINQHKEDISTDFVIFTDFIEEDNVCKCRTILLGDITQIEYEEKIDDNGFRTATKVHFKTADGSKILSNAGFCSSINTNPIIYKSWETMDAVNFNGRLFPSNVKKHGTNAHLELHSYPEKIYRASEGEVELIDSYNNRKLAENMLIEEFINRNQTLIEQL